jgi:uncharacterized membrane protein
MLNTKLKFKKGLLFYRRNEALSSAAHRINAAHMFTFISRVGKINELLVSYVVKQSSQEMSIQSPYFDAVFLLIFGSVSGKEWCGRIGLL